MPLTINNLSIVRKGEMMTIMMSREEEEERGFKNRSTIAFKMRS